MIRRIIFVIVFIPTVTVLIVIGILSALWWVVTGKNLLWMVDKITLWMNNIIR